MTNYLYSLLLHVALVSLAVGAVNFRDKHTKRKPLTVKFKVIEQPVTKKAKPKAIPPPLVKPKPKKPKKKISKPKKKTKQKPKKKTKKKARKVFGVSKQSMTSKHSTAPVVKQGNTIAAPVDQKKLRPNDAEELPIPKAEYLITDMPAVLAESVIIYPRGMQLEGTVILSILIDERGRVRDAEVVKSLATAMDSEALRAIKLYRFSPAKIEDTPVAVRIRYAIKFVLESN